jgi:hypothetical protein
MSDGRLLESYGPPPQGNYSPHLSIAISPSSERIVTGNVRHLLAIRFPILLDTIVQEGEVVSLRWTGGYDAYQVQFRTFESPDLDWSDMNVPTSDRSLGFVPDGPSGMFRVVGHVP